MNITLPVVTSAALLDSLNPCAISVLLLTIGFLISARHTGPRILVTTGVYIAGIFITYILIGLGVLHTLTLFSFPHILSKFGAAVIIGTGLLGLAKVPLGIPTFIKPRLAALIHRGTLPAMFALGVLVGLFEFPCTGGPYLFILALLHDKMTFASGFTYLVYYNVIFVSPLIIISLIANNPRLLAKFQAWRQANSATADLYSSLAMIILGAIIFLL